jgi:hypothetical protein
MFIPRVFLPFFSIFYTINNNSIYIASLPRILIIFFFIIFFLIILLNIMMNIELLSKKQHYLNLTKDNKIKNYFIDLKIKNLKYSLSAILLYLYTKLKI